MRVPRYYIKQSISVGDVIALPDEVHRHAIQVLRGKVGDQLVLFNGKGGEYAANFVEVNRRNSSVSITQFDDANVESSLHTTLVLALIKSDKFDFAIQKAVEMGVNTIRPVSTERSVLALKNDRVEKKMLHWQGIINSACEQCGRTSIPELMNIESFSRYLEREKEELCITMLPTASKKLSDMQTPSRPIALLVGPEGGFTDDEVSSIESKGIETVQFGPRILRAETAVIAGLALCQSLWGDL